MSGTYSPEQIEAMRARATALGHYASQAPKSSAAVLVCRCGHVERVHSGTKNENSFTWYSVPEHEGGPGVDTCFAHPWNKEKESDPHKPWDRVLPTPCGCPGWDPVLEGRGVGQHFIYRSPREVGSKRIAANRRLMPPLQSALMAIIDENERRIRVASENKARPVEARVRVASPKDLDKALNWIVGCEECAASTQALEAVYADADSPEVRIVCFDCATRIFNSWAS